MSPAYGCALLTFRLYRDYRDISRLSKHSSFTSGLGEFTQREFLGACRWRSVHTNSVCQGSSSWVWLLMLVAPELTFIFMFKLPTIFTFWFGLFGFCLQPFVACPTSAEISQETIVLLACFRSPLPDKTPRSHLRTRSEGVFVVYFCGVKESSLKKHWVVLRQVGLWSQWRTSACGEDNCINTRPVTDADGMYVHSSLQNYHSRWKAMCPTHKNRTYKKVDLVDVFPRCRQYDKTWKTVWNGCIMRTSSLVQFWKGVCDGIKDSKAFVDHVWPHQRRGAATTLLDFNWSVNSEQIRSWTSWELQRQWRSPEGTTGRAKVFGVQIPIHYWKDHDTDDTRESLQGCSLWICVEANFMKERPDARTFMDTGFDRFSEILKGSCPRWNCDRFFFTRLRV